jgi:ferric-dicitrate binding protein FerR (iron transport regulator)
MSKETELYELFRRFAEGNYSLEDLKKIKKEVENPTDEKSLEAAIKHHWYHDILSGEESAEEVDLRSCLDKIHQRIYQMGSPQLSGQNRMNRFLTRSLHIYYRVAAVLLIPFMIMTAMFLMNRQAEIPVAEEQEVQQKPVYSEIIAPMGSRIRMGLPDGTKVWLNHGSKLKYPQSFGKESRNVQLVGEAYFEVVEDRQRPFVVNTGVMEVYATGTSFNVMAYKDDQDVAVSLDEGSVELYKLYQDNEIRQKVYDLKPEEHAVYHKEPNTMEIIEGRNDIYTAWKKGRMIFRQEPLNQIVKKLERWYNVDIVLNNPDLATHEFTATLTDETLSQVLDLFSKAAPLEYTFLPRVKKEDNSFAKRKVVINLLRTD